jgi:hypothetical protein
MELTILDLNTQILIFFLITNIILIIISNLIIPIIKIITKTKKYKKIKLNIYNIFYIINSFYYINKSNLLTKKEKFNYNWFVLCNILHFIIYSIIFIIFVNFVLNSSIYNISIIINKIEFLINILDSNFLYNLNNSFFFLMDILNLELNFNQMFLFDFNDSDLMNNYKEQSPNNPFLQVKKMDHNSMFLDSHPPLPPMEIEVTIEETITTPPIEIEIEVTIEVTITVEETNENVVNIGNRAIHNDPYNYFYPHNEVSNANSDATYDTDSDSDDPDTSSKIWMKSRQK